MSGNVGGRPAGGASAAATRAIPAPLQRGHEPRQRARELGPLLRARFGRPVRKLALRIGTTCPNRDGTLGVGGCLYCAGTPSAERSLEEQIETGLARLGDDTVAIAYLQDHSATHLPAEELDRILTLLRTYGQIVRIAIGTRPDCLPGPVLEVLARHGAASELLVELGLQSADDRILAFVRRLHTVAAFADAVRRLHRQSLAVCAHVILGLPSPLPDGTLVAEPAQGAARTAQLLGELGVEAVKVHNCHVLRGTALASLRAYTPPDLAGYVERLAAFLAHLPPTVEVHRLVGEARPPALVAPAFCADKSRTLQLIRAELERRDVWQGSACDRSAP